MASKATANPTNWLTRDGVETEVWMHAGGRLVQTNQYDHGAPKHRRWTVSVLNRDTSARATVSGEHAYETRDLAFAQIDALPDDRARKLRSA